MNTYHSLVIFRKKLFFVLMIYFFVLVILILLTIYKFKYESLQFFCLAFFVLPLIFIKKIIDYYTFEIEVTINKESLDFKIKDKKNNQQYNSTNILFATIRQYEILFVNRRFADIIIYSEEDKKFTYSFLRKSELENQISADQLIKKIQESIIVYNTGLTKKRINLKPSFYASKLGLYSILLLVILFITAIICHILYSLKTLPVSLFLGFMILIQLILRRKTDMDFYKENK